MLTEKRYEIILSLLKEKGLIKVTELMDSTNTSESTIRRDLCTLESKGLLQRIHGGAKSINYTSKELSFKEKSTKNIHEKNILAKYVASLIEDGECIFLDAGTSTYEIIKYLRNKDILVVTTGLNHIDALVDNDIRCYMIGGNVKLNTKAIVGSHAIKCLNKFRFDKCFIGTNGIDLKAGFTTPDCEEASIKSCAIDNSKISFVLADNSKFNEISFVKFSELEKCIIITNKENGINEYKEITDIKVVVK